MFQLADKCKMTKYFYIILFFMKTRTTCILY